jgi:transposase, IS5 family
MEGGRPLWRERDAPMTLFDLVPALRRTRDPVLTHRDRGLDDETLFQAVNADWIHRCPRTPMDGRPSTPVEVLLRRLVVKPLDGGRDEATARWVSESLGLRQCCRVDVASGPEDTTLGRGAHLIPPATWPRLRDHVGALARSLTVTRGRQRRMDGTVVEPPSHHPSDRTVLDEGGRLLSRTLTNATRVVPPATSLGRGACRERTRRAKRQMPRLMAVARQRGAQADARMRGASQRRRTITPATVAQAAPGSAVLPAQATHTGHTLAATVRQGVPWVPRVIPQTPRRRIQGAVVPAPEHVGRLCAPHPAMIRQGTPGKPTAFGRVSWWDDVEGGIMRRDAVLEGNPAEDAPLPPRLDPHRRGFQRPPRLRAGARGLHPTANER